MAVSLRRRRTNVAVSHQLRAPFTQAEVTCLNELTLINQKRLIKNLSFYWNTIARLGN
jgi:hypothetical protein